MNPGLGNCICTILLLIVRRIRRQAPGQKFVHPHRQCLSQLLHLLRVWVDEIVPLLEICVQIRHAFLAEDLNRNPQLSD